jgi:hypothetical protein
MSPFDEKRWREALERRGKEWAQRTLNSRHGQAGDSVLDVVFVDPHPTREFVQCWCAEESNKMPKLSGTTIAAMVTFALLLIAARMAVSSLNNTQQTQHDDGLTPYRTPVWTADIRTNPFPDPAPTVTSGPPSAATTLPATCAYATYPTAACPRN